MTITVACPADGRAVGGVEEYGALEPVLLKPSEVKRTQPRWYPHRRWTNALIRRVLRVATAPDLRRRLR